MVFDVLSKYAWVPIVDKSGDTVADAFEHVLKNSGGRVIVQSDAAKEFVSRKLQAVLKENRIDFKPVRIAHVKAVVAE